MVLLVLMFLVPLFFFPFTSNIFELNKQVLFLVLTFASALLWIGSMLVNKKVSIKRGWVNILPFLILIPHVVSAWFSNGKYLSWIGLDGQEYTSVITILGAVVLFYLIVNLLDSKKIHKKIHLTLLISSFLAGLVAVLSLFNISIFSFEAANANTFNTIGTMNSLAVFLIAMTVFASGVWVSHKDSDSILHDGLVGLMERLMILALHATTIFILLVLDYWILWLLLIFGIVIMFTFMMFRPKDFAGSGRGMLPLLMIVIAIPFWLWLQSPFSFKIPTEITPNAVASQHVTKQTFTENSPVYGSGPGTYKFDYTKYHGTNINGTDFWNLKFDKASSYFWTLLPTVGILGTGGLVLFIIFLGAQALVQIFKPSKREWLQSFVAFCPWAVFIFAASLYPFNITLMLFFMIFSGLLGSQSFKKETDISIEKPGVVKFIVSLLFVSGAFAFLVGIFFSTQTYMAEVAYAKAVKLDRANAPIEDIVRLLDRASSLNGHNDTYYRALSISLLHRISSELKTVGAEQMTQEKRQYVQGLVGASVNSVIRATDLSPNNISNWYLRGYIYRELSSLVGNADDFAVSAHVKATELEPDNPSVWTELGKTYLIVGSNKEMLQTSKDPIAAKIAREETEDIYLRAEKVFERAIALKPNYAAAHFGLGTLYERQGDLTEAIRKTEDSLKLNDLDAGVHLRLGLLRLKRGAAGDLAAAEVAFQEAITLVPTYSNARWYLATVYEKKRDVKKAIEQIEKVLEYNPGNTQVKERLNRLYSGNVSSGIPDAI